LKGQVMKLSKGKANPAVVGEILEKKLGSVAEKSEYGVTADSADNADKKKTEK